MEPVIVQNLYIKVLMATQRAKQLEKGARPRIVAGDKKYTRIAIEEVERGLIGYEFDALPDAIVSVPRA